MNKWLVTSFIALAFAVNAAQAAGTADEGQKKSTVCAGCHGADGNSGINPLWPKLAGQHPKYIEKQLKDFQVVENNQRKDPLMTAMALPLSDQDIADLAAYFSSQTRTGGSAAADMATPGEKIYRAGNMKTGVAACMACHGPTGAGNPDANFPSLAGQNAAYVDKALKDFRSGARSNDLGKMMQGVVERMTDDEIAAVSQYIQGLSK